MKKKNHSKEKEKQSIPKTAESQRFNSESKLSVVKRNSHLQFIFSSALI